MKYTGLNNKIYFLNTSKYLRKSTNPSKLHLKAREFFAKQLSMYTVLEEISLKGFPSGTLYMDFMIPSLALCVEIQGQQHFKQISHFQTKQQFLNQKMRDNWKKQICELNDWRLVEFNFNDTESQWMDKLNEPN